MTYRCAILLMTVLAMACGGSDNGGTPTSPTPTPGTPPVSTTTITITSAGVSPKDITVSPGTRVTFVNNDSVSHEMNSNPHPTHGDCPAIDQIAFLAAGQSKMTGNLNDVRVCGYHDHNRPDLTALQGTITSS